MSRIGKQLIKVPTGVNVEPTLRTGPSRYSKAFSLIKEATNQYRQHISEGGDLSFGEFIERSAELAKTGGKSAILGGFFGLAGKLIPVLKSFPKLDKFLTSKFGKKVEKPLAEAVTLLVGESALQGKLPSPNDIIDTFVAVAGFNIAHKSASKIRTKLFNTTPAELAAEKAAYLAAVSIKPFAKSRLA